jgi:hypothetical protein
MKWAGTLLAVALLLAVYLFKGHGVAAAPTAREKIVVAVRSVSAVPVRIPAGREINYFETDKDFSNWIGRHGEFRGIVRQRSKKFVSQGRYSMEVYWRLKRWGEMVLLHFPQDWQYYQRFAFDVYNPGPEGFTLEVRVGDLFDSVDFNPDLSRFVAQRRIGHGFNRVSFRVRDIGAKIKIDAERKIIRLRILSSDKLFYLDNMRLY